ncbi:hypothetical protein C8Q79DRAFT_715995 [Trametes meyenii]|nr:hypothetical protein C8Q79DRAFT_715995 [Trametes meyenii]
MLLSFASHIFYGPQFLPMVFATKSKLIASPFGKSNQALFPYATPGQGMQSSWGWEFKAARGPAPKSPGCWCARSLFSENTEGISVLGPARGARTPSGPGQRAGYIVAGKANANPGAKRLHSLRDGVSQRRLTLPASSPAHTEGNADACRLTDRGIFASAARMTTVCLSLSVLSVERQCGLPSAQERFIPHMRPRSSLSTIITHISVPVGRR